jgi:hypothetical protein
VTRTPRQQQGEDLVKLTILLPRPVLTAVAQRALDERRSMSAIGRRAVEAFLGMPATAAPGSC